VLTVTGHGFARMGDVRCRFGALNMETNASVLDANRLTCLSPRSWMAEEAAAVQAVVAVHLEVTLNGQQFFGRSVLGENVFRYFALDRTFGLSVRSITPSGGSSVGGTLVTVRGTGFLRGTWATVPECRFGEHGTVPATIRNGEELTCASPTWATNGSSSFFLEVGINGEAVAFTSGAAASFSYHTPSHLDGIHPLGGSQAGGTLLTITGTNFRELDHGHGLRCLFGEPREANPGAHVRGLTGLHHAAAAPAPVVTFATVADRSSLSSIKCFSPPLELLTHLYARPDGEILQVPVRVTNNGLAGPGDQTVNTLNFSFISLAVAHKDVHVNQELEDAGVASVEVPPYPRGGAASL